MRGWREGVSEGEREVGRAGGRDYDALQEQEREE